MTERESMSFDVLIVGGGPAGLSAACRLKQLSQEAGHDISICVIEKGSEIGAHIVSGAVFEPSSLNELFPDWKGKEAPLHTPVTDDELYWMGSSSDAKKIPSFFIPPTMHNQGNYIISLGNLCRWMAEQAESMGVEIFPGFAAHSVLFGPSGAVQGVITGDMGKSANGEEKEGFMPGMELQAKYTLFAEGCRGHLGKQLIQHFHLDEGKDPQQYALGIKELWQINENQHRPGLVTHTTGWPLTESKTQGGGFLYHLENNQVAVGLITDLGYTNPYVDPYEEFQRFKHHPVIKYYLEGGKRVAYGARAIAKGGLSSLPKMTFPGGLLIGCDAGTLNYAKIKGSHTAMKSGMLAAEVVINALIEGGCGQKELVEYGHLFRESSIFHELHHQRNFGPMIHKFGTLAGGACSWIDLKLFRGKLPFSLKYRHAPHEQLQPASASVKIDYPKPDNAISFDRMSSVFLSNTNHEEDQPCHLVLVDAEIPVKQNLPAFAEPAQRYCPAGVYEIVTDEKNGTQRFQINSQNCVHCKTCDIKDPSQNITWVTPEGGGGPNYPNM